MVFIGPHTGSISFIVRSSEKPDLPYRIPKKNIFFIRIFLKKVHIHTQANVVSSIRIDSLIGHIVSRPIAIVHGKIIPIKINISIQLPSIECIIVGRSCQRKDIRSEPNSSWQKLIQLPAYQQAVALPLAVLSP